MNKTLLAATTAIMVMTTACTQKEPLQTGIHIENLDMNVCPQQDFYQFATGGWQQQNPLTGEYARFGSFDKLGLQNLEQVNGLIQDIAATEHKHGSVEQKIGDIYNLAMDTARRNNEGYEAIRRSIEEIDGVTDRSQLSGLLGKSMEYSLWAMYVDADALNSSMNILNEYQAGFALGQKEYYLDEDEHTRSIREAYLKHIARMFSLYGIGEADQAAQTVLRLETRLAKAAKSNVELRDPIDNYNKMSIEELKQLVPQINWDEYFAAMDIKTDSLSVGQKEHLAEAGRMLGEEPLEDLKTLLKWQVLDGAASYLTDEMYAANFDFYGRVLSGKEEQSPLWKRAVGMVNGTLGEAVGQMYVKKYFPEENKKRMLSLVKNLQKALSERIAALEWMSDETKAKAQEKLASMTIKIGYPDTWRDYSKLDIDPALSYYENIQRAAKFEQEYSLSYLNKPVDKTKWYMTPQTVNAYYNPSSNEICFPAGILQYPFFDMSADDAFNYGAIGVVIGHEMTHGFDDQGCLFDKDGNLQNWWTAEDKARFDERTAVMRDYFDNIEVAPGVHANGAFTLGENIADHGGLQISYQAFASQMKKNGLDPMQACCEKKEGCCKEEQKCCKEDKSCCKEGEKKSCCSEGQACCKEGDKKACCKDGGAMFSPAQRFFLAYANVWAANIRDEEILQRTKSDPHSLGRWRVNGALPHIGAWYEAWNITEESPLYLAPEKRVSIW